LWRGKPQRITIRREVWGGQGVPVWVCCHPPQSTAGQFSSYTRRTGHDGGRDESQVEISTWRSAARNNLDQWCCFPTQRMTRRMLTRFHSKISRRFPRFSPNLEVCEGAMYDKRLSTGWRRRTRRPYDDIYIRSRRRDSGEVNCDVPVNPENPAIHASINRLTEDKVGCAANRRTTGCKYREARDPDACGSDSGTRK